MFPLTYPVEIDRLLIDELVRTDLVLFFIRVVCDFVVCGVFS